MAVPFDGFHHVTLLAGDPAANVRFTTELLGLRLLKVTVNFDDPGVYHLYYGDGAGTPGTVLTHFPYGSAIRRGRRGSGEARAITLIVPLNSLGGWKARLHHEGVEVYDVDNFFGARQLRFHDPDGAELRLEERNETIRVPWAGMPVPPESAIVRIGAVEIAAPAPRRFGLVKVGEEGRTMRYQVGDAFLDTVAESADEPRAEAGAGSIHHVAFRTPDDGTQAEWQAELGNTSEVRDRDYFRSIYVREPGGVLYEVATDGPGFTVDETFENLGKSLQLPAALAGQRDLIAAALPSLPTIPTRLM